MGLGNRDMLEKTWIFNASQYVLFGLMLGVEMIIPDVPKDVKTQLKRQAHLVSKVIRKDPDEVEDTQELIVTAKAGETQLHEDDDDAPARSRSSTQSFLAD